MLWMVQNNWESRNEITFRGMKYCPEVDNNIPGDYRTLRLCPTNLTHTELVIEKFQCNKFRRKILLLLLLLIIITSLMMMMVITTTTTRNSESSRIWSYNHLHMGPVHYPMSWISFYCWIINLQPELHVFLFLFISCNL